jgi:hypothetical protein
MGTTVDGSKRTNSRYRKPEGKGWNYYGSAGYGSTFPGWTGHKEKEIELQRKTAVELCDVPTSPDSRYHTGIVYGDHEVGAIWFSGGTWRVTIGMRDYGRFKTFLGARKYAYRWFGGLDIDPGDIEAAELN